MPSHVTHALCCLASWSLAGTPRPAQCMPPTALSVSERTSLQYYSFFPRPFAIGRAAPVNCAHSPSIFSPRSALPLPRLLSPHPR